MALDRAARCFHRDAENVLSSRLLPFSWDNRISAKACVSAVIFKELQVGMTSSSLLLGNELILFGVSPLRFAAVEKGDCWRPWSVIEVPSERRPSLSQNFDNDHPDAAMEDRGRFLMDSANLALETRDGARRVKPCRLFAMPKVVVARREMSFL